MLFIMQTEKLFSQKDYSYFFFIMKVVIVRRREKGAYLLPTSAIAECSLYIGQYRVSGSCLPSSS